MKTKALFLALSLLACDVPVVRPGETGLGEAWMAAGEPGCPRGLVVSATDQVQSANIGLASITGQSLSPSIISSASQKPGLTAALGGDIVFPSMPTVGDELVVLDRYPKSVINWVNLRTAQVRAQLSVATGYVANPHDYVPLTTQKAYVTRFDPNPIPGREAFDGGSDILIIDPSIPSMVGRIDLTTSFPPNGSLFVHPDRARLIGGRVYAVLPYYDRSFSASGESYIAVIDPQTDIITERFLIKGASGCVGLDVTTDESSLAVVCSGSWNGSIKGAGNASSAIVGLRLAPQLSEIWRVAASQLANRAFGFNIAFVDSTHVLTTQLGELGPPLVEDVAYVIDVSNGSATVARRSASLSSGPCNAGCGACYISDAATSTLINLQFTNPRRYLQTVYSWADPTGLPPRSIAFF